MNFIYYSLSELCEFQILPARSLNDQDYLHNVRITVIVRSGHNRK